MVNADFNLIFLCLVLVSIVHSIVLLRVCIHVIDRVYQTPHEKDL